VLTIAGIKMMLGHAPWKIDTSVALTVVVSTLTGAVCSRCERRRESAAISAALAAWKRPNDPPHAPRWRSLSPQRCP